MKAKTIQRVIKNKINHWAESIEDDLVKNLIKEHSIVTGGCIPSMFLNDPVNDFDVYFDSQNVAFKVAEYYTQVYKKNTAKALTKGTEKDATNMWVEIDPETQRIRIMIKSSGIASPESDKAEYQYFETLNTGDVTQTNYIEEVMVSLHAATKKIKNAEEDDKKYQPVFLTSNAITLTGDIQIIFRFHGEPDAIHQNYDFTHCTNYWYGAENELVLRPKALEAILTKELIYQGSLYPICSLIRLRKFIKRGWTVNAGQILKMAYQVNELDLSDVNVLKDQLIGVDVAYFIQLLEIIKDKDPKDINSAYISEIIDKIF